MPVVKEIEYRGYGSFDNIIDIVRTAGAKKIMIVCGSFLLEKSSHIQETINKLSADVVYFSDFTPNPVYEDILTGISLYTNEQCEFIISIGGGSTIDVAKCICILENNQSVLGMLDKPRCQHIAVPTTAGTGSEATGFAVIYKEGEKISVEHKALLPDCVILDSCFLETLPLYHKKSSLVDALCQSIESIWAKGATFDSKEYSKKAIRLILNNLKTYLDGDKDSMALILDAANLSGKAINISKTTAAHAMSYKLTSLFSIAHGHAVALCLIPVWNNLLTHQNDAHVHDAQVLSALDDISDAVGSTSYNEAYERIKEIIDEMFDRSEFSYDEDEIYKLVKSVNLQRLSNHPVSISKETLADMYREILISGHAGARPLQGGGCY